MKNTQVTVIARAMAQAGKEAAVREQLLSLIEPTRKEAGCVNYDLHQAAGNPGVFLFHETWESQAHLDAHLLAEHTQTVLGRVSQLVAEPPEITIWEKIS